MSTRKRRASSIDLADLPDRDELRAVLDELGEASAAVKVWRLIDGKQKYLGAMSPAEFNHDAVRERWGGGDFLVRVVNSDGDFVKRGNKTISIEGLPKIESAPAQVAVAAPAPDPTMQSILRRLEALSAPPQRQPMSGGEIAALITAGVGAVVSLIEVTRPKGGGSGPNVDTMVQLIELGRELGGKPAEETGFAAVAKHVAEPLGLLLTRAATGAQNGATAVQPTPTPATALADPLAQLEPYVPQLESLAARGADVVVYANLIDDAAPDVAELLAELERQHGADGLLDMIGQRFPTLAPRRPWVSALIRAILDTEDDDAAAQ